MSNKKVRVKLVKIKKLEIKDCNQAKLKLRCQFAKMIMFEINWNEIKVHNNYLQTK